MKRILTICTLSSILLTCGCALKPLGDVTAESGRPASAAVDIISIPYDPAKPKYVLVVEPFKSSQDVITVTHGEAGSVPVTDKMAAQLVTALSKVGNFVIYQKASQAKVGKGQKGPYILTATLTEFNEAAEGQAESTDVSLGGVGAVMGIAGAVSGNSGLGWTGAGLAAANPSYHEGSSSVKGMVAFDVQVVEKSTGRIVNSFEAAGTFKSEAGSKGIGLFGISNQKAAFASSAIGQALRAAMNDAVKKTVDALE